ncbi:NADH-quinone oxidoreductase subunit N [Phycisphaerales bacterium AB-hyl4]|uniref:NADH-quinone oxidoreductase subunit N n=1 Tax=Natronomicrosphaera hydrolytica TaxID=3242702 RepID=A0ABV4U153_9BACT
MEEMLAKFASLWPEIALLVGAGLCLITGLHRNPAVRQATVWVAAASLVVAGILIAITGVPYSEFGFGAMTVYIKYAAVVIGLLLLMVSAGVPEQVRQNRLAESAKSFDPGNSTRGEFYAFFLMTIVGVMITAGADDLVWLFLALELTSLPTYVMVATARDRITAQESAVKYFFLGAMSAAVFLYGFTLIYGATGFTNFVEIAAIAQEQAAAGQLSPLLTAGLVLSILGICFKIAAFPMHFYAADVYQGATTAVTTLLAFVPKTAGFIALIYIVSLVGWDPLPPVIVGLLWGLAAITMTVGNVLALLQTNVKRVLAYSSIAHSGYMLVGLLAGPAVVGGSSLNNGIAALLFYLVAYGLATIASFGVLGCLRARGDEAETYDDIAGLWQRSPALAGVLVLSVISLLGLPPLVGFLGKLYLIGAAYTGGYIWLIIVLVINSAISAAYYLAIANAAFFGKPSPHVTFSKAPARGLASGVAAVLAVVLGVAGMQLVDFAHASTIITPTTEQAVEVDDRPTGAAQSADEREAESPYVLQQSQPQQPSISSAAATSAPATCCLIASCCENDATSRSADTR